MKTFLLVNDEARFELFQFVESLDKEKAYTVRIGLYKSSRTLAQNALYWKWLSEIQKHIFLHQGQTYSSDDIHEYMKKRFLPKVVTEIMGEVIKKQISTTKLNVGKFSDYLGMIDYYCNEELQLTLTHPDDVYHKAMGN